MDTDFATKPIDVDGGQRVGPTGALLVRGLQGTDVCGKGKVMYCEMWIGKKSEGRKFKTGKCKKGTCPRWDDEWQVSLTGECLIKIRLYGDGYMGSLNLDLESGFQVGGGHKLVSSTGPLRGSKKKSRAKVVPMGTLKLTFEFHPDPWQVIKPLSKPRVGHTTTLLNSGSIFVVGGCPAKFQDATGACEVINPDKTHERNELLMKLSRAYHTATKLLNGDVLVCGGVPQERHGNESGYRSTEVYNGKRFMETAQMRVGRYRHTAILLQDGCVLVVGGLDGDRSLPSGEIYDPKANKWYDTAPLEKGVFGHSLTLLPDGRVFLLGGGSSKMPGENQVNSMFYLPDADRWVKGPTVPAPYLRHSVLNMSDGTILLMPGSDWWTSYTPNKQQNYSTKVFAFDTKKGAEGQLIQVGRTRTSCGSTARLKGDVVVYFGGFLGYKGIGVHSNWLDYSKQPPGQGFDGSWFSIENMLAPRTDNTTTLLADGRRLVIVGGMGPDLNIGLTSIHLFSFNSSQQGLNCTEPETETFYGQNAQPLKSRVVPVLGGGGDLLAKSPSKGISKVKSTDPKPAVTTSPTPIPRVQPDPAATAARKAALADLKDDIGIVDPDDGSFVDEEGSWEADAMSPRSDGFIPDEDGFEPEEEELDLDALVQQKDFNSTFTSQRAAQAQAMLARQDFSTTSQYNTINQGNLLAEADNLINSVLGGGAGMRSPQQPMIPQPTFTDSDQDQKLQRARQGLLTAIGEVLQQIRTVSVQMVMANSLDMVPVLINQSKILKTVKSALLEAGNVISLQDYQVIPTPMADKLQFAKNYLQQEISGLEGLISSVEFQIRQVTTVPACVQLIQIMMNVKALMRPLLQ